MDDKPLISIILILNDFYHLAPLSFRSIVAQKEKCYEIVVIETCPYRKQLQGLKNYSENISAIYHFDNMSTTVLMNKGLSVAKGQYIHFLFSGDTYVSPYAMGYLREIMEERKYPDLISAAFLKRDQFSAPEAVNFSFDYFKKGKIPTHTQSCWFLKTMLDEMQGFDTKYSLKAGFDAICKIFLKKEKNVVFSNRVLTDYEFKNLPSKVFMKRAWENLKIVYNNFGLKKAIYWWFIHDHFRMIKFFMLSVKKAFWNA